MTKHRHLRISEMKVAAIKWKRILYLEGKLYILHKKLSMQFLGIIWEPKWEVRTACRPADHVRSQLNRNDVTFADPFAVAMLINSSGQWSEVFQMNTIFIILPFLSQLSLCCMEGKWILMLYSDCLLQIQSLLGTRNNISLDRGHLL